MRLTRSDICSLAALAIILAFVVLWQFAPAHEVVWKYDEGVNVAKSSMVLRGYALYHDIWCDQPPLFTFGLAVAMRLFGESILVARFLVLGLTLIGLGGTYALARRISGAWFALIAIVLIVLLPHFQELSRRVLIGWPSIAMALVALALAAAYHEKRRQGILIASGLCFAGSLLIKPIAVPMFPALIWLVWCAEDEPSWRDIPWRPLLTLGASMALPALAAVAYGGLPFLDQVVGVLLRAREEHSLAANAAELWAYLADDNWGLCHLGMATMGLIGVVKLGIERRWAWFGLMIVWLVPVLVALFWQTPLRRHEIFLLIPPLAIAASAGLSHCVQVASCWSQYDGVARMVALLGAVSVVLWAWWLPATLREAIALRRDASAPPQAAMHQEAVDFLRTHTPPDSTLISDDPMLARLSDRHLPPSLVVASFRRYAAGDLGGEMFGLTEQVSPAAIVIWRGTFGRIAGYRDWVESNYCLARVYKTDETIYLPLPNSDPMAVPEAISSPVGMSLVGIRPSRAVATPGEEIDLLLYWQADAPMQEDYTLFAHLIEPDGTRLAGHDLRPLDDLLLTSAWEPGMTMAQELRILVPEGTPPGPKLLSVGWYDAQGHRLPLVDASGQPVSDNQVILDVQPIVQWPANTTAPVPEHTCDVTLGDVVRLIGYDAADVAASDDRLDLTLHWSCEAQMTSDYTVFVHLLDASGEIVAQQDQQPGAGEFPTRAWRPGEFIRDTYSIHLPESLAPGQYSLRIGLYDWRTGARLPTTSSTPLARGDHVLLEQAITLMP